MTDVVLASNDAPTTATRSVTARALSILGVFSMERPSMTLSEISRATGLPVATVYRLAGELEEGRFLDRDEDGQHQHHEQSPPTACFGFKFGLSG